MIRGKSGRQSLGAWSAISAPRCEGLHRRVSFFRDVKISTGRGSKVRRVGVAREEGDRACEHTRDVRC